MPLPGHLKAAFQNLRGQATRAQATMLRQKHGPKATASAAVTEPGHVQEEGSMDCPDCASGVCDTHGTGMDELESLHEKGAEAASGHEEQPGHVVEERPLVKAAGQAMKKKKFGHSGF